MDSKQLKDVLAQIEELKTSQTSEEFRAGVDAAKQILAAAVEEAMDLERLQKLEQEIAQLKAKYADKTPAAPKRRGRKPKQVTPDNAEFEKVAGA